MLSSGLRLRSGLGHSRRRIFFRWSHSYFNTLGHCPVAAPILCWPSVCRQMVLSFPAKCLDKLGNSFFHQWQQPSRPWGSKSASIHDAPPPHFTVGMRIWCCVLFSPHIMLCFPSKQLRFGLIGPQNILPVEHTVIFTGPPYRGRGRTVLNLLTLSELQVGWWLPWRSH